jgi:glycosyltransferase involved in cell wall biosynthesis
MKLLFFPRYNKKGASSRYRIYQYLPFFKGFNIHTYPFFNNNYSPNYNYKSLMGILFLISCYSKRFYNMFKLLNKHNICLVQYEFTPYLPFNIFWFRIFNIKYIVDLDDAVFHQYDQSNNMIIRNILKNKISTVIKNADYVITGSPYLTKYAFKYNKNVLEIPTSINIDNYKWFNKDKSDKFIIGWIGSKTTSNNLITLIPVFESLQKQEFNFELRFIGFDEELYTKFKHLPLKQIKWEPNTEVIEISKFDVGIMPLNDNLFNKGKCAFKLIQYMACGIPTISTPLEANIKVNRSGNNLFSKNNTEWEENFKYCYDNLNILRKSGIQNRSIVEKHYTVQVNYNKYINVFESFKN